MKHEPLTADEVLTKILNAKGRYVRAAWKSNPKASKAYPDTVLEKRTVARVVRAGVGFKNIKEIREGIESGERPEVGPLPYGHWVKYPYIIEHKGNLYVRLTRSTIHTKFDKIEFYVDGKKVQKKTFAKYLPTSSAKALLDPTTQLIFNIKMENLIDILE